MVRIFDVFHHQLPVARYALAVVAQQCQLASRTVICFENTVDPRHDGRAKILLDCLDAVTETGKHQAMQNRNTQLSQAVVFDIETFWHPALHFGICRIAIFHTVFKWQARQVAIELVRPLVIRADKTAGVAMRRLAKSHATVCAAVFNDAYAGIKQAVFGCDTVTHHQHLPLTDMAQFVVTRVGDFNLQTDIAPMRTVKNLVQLLAVKLRVGVGPKRDATGGGLLPARGLKI